MAKSSTSFKPGQTGNKGGRPGVSPEVRAYQSARTLPALKRLWKLCRTASEDRDRIAALRIFLAKCLPDMKELEVSGPGGEALGLGLTGEQITKLIDDATAALKAKGNK